ncbi:hypothetical protein ACFVW2_00670 [Streptomyces sp. NPDC058171]
MSRPPKGRKFTDDGMFWGGVLAVLTWGSCLALVMILVLHASSP